MCGSAANGSAVHGYLHDRKNSSFWRQNIFLSGYETAIVYFRVEGTTMYLSDPEYNESFTLTKQ